MSKPQNLPEIPTDAEERAHWVVWQLRRRGSSLKRLAEQHNCTGANLANALRMANARAEQILASALDVPVEDLFKERFTSTGERIPRIRARKRIAASGEHNAKERPAA